MTAASLSVSILRPVEDVFAVLTNVGQAAKWSRAFEEQLITPGPLRVGSRRRAVVPMFGGRTMEDEMEQTELEPDRRLAMRGVAGFPFPVRIVAELEPAGGGSCSGPSPGSSGAARPPCSSRATGGTFATGTSTSVPAPGTSSSTRASPTAAG